MMARMILVAVVLSAGASLAVTPERSESWVDQRIREWQPTARERKWESIGWATGIVEAEQLGKQNRRPVFLFTHDGRLGIGRC